MQVGTLVGAGFVACEAAQQKRKYGFRVQPLNCDVPSSDSQHRSFFLSLHRCRAISTVHSHLMLFHSFHPVMRCFASVTSQHVFLICIVSIFFLPVVQFLGLYNPILRGLEHFRLFTWVATLCSLLLSSVSLLRSALFEPPLLAEIVSC